MTLFQVSLLEKRGRGIDATSQRNVMIIREMPLDRMLYNSIRARMIVGDLRRPDERCLCAKFLWLSCDDAVQKSSTGVS